MNTGSAWGAVLAAMLAGMTAFLFGYRYLVEGARLYRDTFVRRLDGELRRAFILLDARVLFVLNLGAMAVAALAGWWILGVPGVVAALALVAVVPPLWVRVIRRRRINLFIYQLPDCLAAIAASLHAGTNLTRALEQVAEQQPRPVCEEFSVVLSEYRVGTRLEEALERLHQRIPRVEVELMNSAIGISRGVGGNLADTLDSLASTLREKAQVEGKIEALTAMGRMQGWVVGLLPLGVGAMLFNREPEAMAALVAEPVGWLVSAVVLIMMGMAAFMIRKIVNIDV